MAHRLTPNLEGQWFSVGVFLPLAHRFRLFRGARHSPLADVTRLPKHSQGLRWRGRVTNDFSGRAYSLTVGITRRLRGTHWWHLWTSSRPVTLALSSQGLNLHMRNEMMMNYVIFSGKYLVSKCTLNKCILVKGVMSRYFSTFSKSQYVLPSTELQKAMV